MKTDLDWIGRPSQLAKLLAARTVDGAKDALRRAGMPCTGSSHDELAAGLVDDVGKAAAFEQAFAVFEGAVRADETSRIAFEAAVSRGRGPNRAEQPRELQPLFDWGGRPTKLGEAVLERARRPRARDDGTTAQGRGGTMKTAKDPAAASVVGASMKTPKETGLYRVMFVSPDGGTSGPQGHFRTQEEAKRWAGKRKAWIVWEYRFADEKVKWTVKAGKAASSDRGS